METGQQTQSTTKREIEIMTMKSMPDVQSSPAEIDSDQEAQYVFKTAKEHFLSAQRDVPKFMGQASRESMSNDRLGQKDKEERDTKSLSYPSRNNLVKHRRNRYMRVYPHICAGCHIGFNKKSLLIKHQAKYLESRCFTMISNRMKIQHSQTASAPDARNTDETFMVQLVTVPRIGGGTNAMSTGFPAELSKKEAVKDLLSNPRKRK